MSKFKIFSVVLALNFVLSSIGYTAPRALKKLVAVEQFDNKSGAVGNWKIGTGMADMLTDSLIQSGEYKVMERQAVESVLKEQDFAASGRTTQAGSVARIGKMPPVQILIRGAVTEFAESKSGGGQGLNIRGFNINMKKGSAHVAVIIRLIDTSTGEVLDSQRVEGDAEAGGLGLGYSGGGFGFGSSGFTKTPIGKACQIAIDRAVAYISGKTRNMPWQGKVIVVKNGTLIINSGSNVGIVTGDVFDVYNVGEEFIDPDTGMSLGSESSKIGEVEVISVMEKFCKATPISGSGFEAKNVVKSK